MTSPSPKHEAKSVGEDNKREHHESKPKDLLQINKTLKNTANWRRSMFGMTNFTARAHSRRRIGTMETPARPPV